MRLNERSSVLFPHPEGPMIAVTLFGAMARLMDRSAWCFP